MMFGNQFTSLTKKQFNKPKIQLYGWLARKRISEAPLFSLWNQQLFNNGSPILNLESHLYLVDSTINEQLIYFRYGTPLTLWTLYCWPVVTGWLYLAILLLDVSLIINGIFLFILELETRLFPPTRCTINWINCKTNMFMDINCKINIFMDITCSSQLNQL